MKTSQPPSVDALIEAASVELDDDLVLRLVFDVAHRIHDSDTIGRRYGLGGEAGLRRFLGTHPTIVDHARKLRAIVESDQGAEMRARQKAVFATEELIAPMAALAANPQIPSGTRIDAFKQLNRVAGVDGMPAIGKDQTGDGRQFVVNFNFSGGRTEQIATTVVEHDVEVLAP